VGKEVRLTRELDEFRLRILILAKDKDESQAEFEKQNKLLNVDSDTYFQDCQEVPEVKPADVHVGKSSASGLSEDERKRGKLAEAAKQAREAAAAPPADIPDPPVEVATAAQLSVALIPVDKAPCPLNAHQQKILDDRVASALVAVGPATDDIPVPKRRCLHNEDDEMAVPSDEEKNDLQARAANFGITGITANTDKPSSG
jgi:hypothetical protein